MSTVTSTKTKAGRPRKAPEEKKKPGPKPIMGVAFTAAEKQARKQARLGDLLQQAIDEARAAREAMERLAEESSRALAGLDQVPGMAEARSRQEQAFEAAGKAMTALEGALGVRGKLLGVKVA